MPEAFVDAIEPHVAPQVWALVQLQRLTGMRPGEVTTMRTCDIDTSGAAWIYTPARHKTQHHGHARQIHLGPQAQRILQPWLRMKLDEYLFQPGEAAQWLRKSWDELASMIRFGEAISYRRCPPAGPLFHLLLWFGRRRPLQDNR